MKTKAACDATGLTRKSLLLYEKKGLITSEKRWSNGREYREYSEENIRELRQIAVLRKAWFTMDEIRRMKERPEETPEIFGAYYQWLLAQREELEELLKAAEDLRRTGVTDMAQLAQRLEQPARSLPLPPADVHPRFRYLDELEERPPRVQIQTNLEEDGGNMGYWHLAMERKGGIKPVSYDDIFRGLGFEDYKTELENGIVASKLERDPKWMRVVKGVFMILTLGSLALVLIMPIKAYPGFYEDDNNKLFHWPLAWIGLFAFSALIRGLLGFLTWRKQNRKWQAEDREKSKPNIRG